MIKRIALLVIILTLSLSAPALAAEDGVIEGRLVNGTAGGSSTANVDVILKTYLNDVEAAQTPAEANAEGYFIFDGLNTESGYSYQVGTTFQEVEYYSDRLSFAEGETTISTEVAVYDSTTSDAAIRIITAHSIVYVGEGSLEVVEWIWFENESDLTYVGSKEVGTEGDKETLKFFLPDGASAPQLGASLMECCIYNSVDGFIDTMPVPPGIREIAFSYQVDYSSGEYAFFRKLNYPVDSFDFLVQGESVEVTGDRLTVEEPLDISGSWFNHLSGQDLAAGDIININLSGLPQTASQTAIVWVIMAVVILGAAFGFIYLKRNGGPQPVSLEESLDQKRQRLLVELAQLDDDFEAGKIQEESYRRLRSAKKTQLVGLV